MVPLTEIKALHESRPRCCTAWHGWWWWPQASCQICPPALLLWLPLTESPASVWTALIGEGCFLLWSVWGIYWSTFFLLLLRILCVVLMLTFCLFGIYIFSTQFETVFCKKNASFMLNVVVDIACLSIFISPWSLLKKYWHTSVRICITDGGIQNIFQG